MMQVPFIRMNGAGNDFVVLDGRLAPPNLSEAQVKAICARSNDSTKGCDQLIVLERSHDAHVFMRIYNADGSQVSACGNATRCIARLVAEEMHADNVTIETRAGLLSCYVHGEIDEGYYVEVDMGFPKLEWNEIPLSEERDTLHLQIGEGELQDPVGVSMGNPHAVFFVPDVAAVDLATLGPKLENHPLFPERANIGIAQIDGQDEYGRDIIRLRVWERGAGETPACGTGACAALVAAYRRKLAGRTAKIYLPGGMIAVVWMGSGRVLMIGPAEQEFTGFIEL